MQPGASASVEAASGAILASLGAATSPPALWGNAGFVNELYINMLDKTDEDDPSGAAYWVNSLGTSSRGLVVEQIQAGALASTDATLIQNRLDVLDCAVRLAKQQQVTSRVSDLKSLIRRVTADPASKTEALDRYADLVGAGFIRPRNALDTPMSPSTLWSTSSLESFDGVSARVARRVVWWNRSGDPLLAHVVLPMSFQSRTNWPVVVLAHGGGWRAGFPEDLLGYATHLAARGFVAVIAEYRLTSVPGNASPAGQNDLADAVSVVKANAAAFGIDPGKVGLFGLSAGGHLAVLLGSTSNMGCVAALFPPLDLGAGNLIPGAPIYVNSYLNGASAASVSPLSVYSSAFTTKFHLQHSQADGTVPYAQSQAFVTLVGAQKATLLTFSACPGTSAATLCDAHSGRGYSGSDRVTSLNALEQFFKVTCGYN